MPLLHISDNLKLKTILTIKITTTMITIESRHIMDAIRNSCPLSTYSYSVNRITLLPPISANKSFGIARFETTEKEIEVTCAWYVDIMPEQTTLVIKWIGKDEAFSIKL